MTDFSNYLKNEILGWVSGVAIDTEPAAVYCALWNGDPTDDGLSGTEVTTTIAAARIAISLGAISSNESIANDTAVDFGDADAGATITHFAVFDASVAGNMLFHSALDTTRVVVTSDPVEFPIGDLTILLQ